MADQKKGIWITERDFRAVSAPKLDQVKEIATRQRAGEAIGFGMYLPNPDQILRNLGLEISAYRALLPDSHVGACIVSRKSGVKCLNWSIDRDKSPSEPAKFIESVFKDLDIERITGEILNAPLFGYSVLEIMWEQKNGKIYPVDIVGKPPEWFLFDTENSLRFKSVTNILGEPLPPMKFLLASHEADYQNPYGFALLSRCFWPVTFKKGGWKFWVKFVEKYGGAFAIGKHPRGAQEEEIEALADTLNAMIQSAVAVIPDDASVQITESAGKTASGDLYERLIKAGEDDISKALVGQTLTTQVGTTGSYAASNTHMQVRADIVDADKKLVCSVYNTLVRWIYELNFGGNERPVFSLWADEDVDLPQAERDAKLAQTQQIRFRKPYWTRTYGFKEDEIDEVEPNTGQPSAFSESVNIKLPEIVSDSGAAAQEAVDELIKAIPAEMLQGQAAKMLEPVIDMIKNGESIEQTIEALADLYPKMNTDDLVDTLHRLIFVTELWGKISGQRPV
jgi:phage gp29-like protein